MELSSPALVLGAFVVFGVSVASQALEFQAKFRGRNHSVHELLMRLTIYLFSKCYLATYGGGLFNNLIGLLVVKAHPGGPALLHGIQKKPKTGRRKITS